MLRLDNTYLRIQIGTISVKKEQLQWLVEWLVELHLQVEKVASFGCGIGTETLALMWALGASEAVGIDKDEESIDQARSTLTNIRDYIKRIQRTLQYYRDLPEDLETWWDVVAPSFFKEELLREGNVEFLVRDITESTGLQSDYYDVAFCDSVLYHIWLDQGGEEKTQRAIEEMVRGVRLGGAVAVSEPTQCTDEPTYDIDFKPLFGQAGLKPIHVKEKAHERGRRTEYLYLKEGVA